MLWDKGQSVAAWVQRFTVGEDYRWDTLLLPYDIEGTRAHAAGLHRIGILSDEEFRAVSEALDALKAEVAAGRVVVRPEDEDAHTVIETYLTKRLGDTGKKIHTGRSRNDQVLTAIRLFLKDGLREAGRRVARLVEQLCELGTAYNDALMPGYTHLQQAMPSTAGLWALGYAELLLSDLAALRHAFDQVDVSPLGSAAGYGVPFLELPREEVARRLGFRALQLHVTAVQLSRGKLELHAAHALVQVGATLNRIASDLVLFNSQEFGFVELPPECCTGSSIMPQKQNPDVPELVRAGYHRLLAEMNVLLTLPANLPSGYHRDLQLTKEAVVRCVLHAHDLLTAMVQLLPGLRFRRDRMQAACTPALLATAEALRRVAEGVPFREAYRQAAAALDSLPQPDPETVLRAYRVDGYPGRGRPDRLLEQLRAFQDWLAPTESAGT
ncbi:argininosuccinate lyase [Rhodothermus marinus]|uniref:Argininosuccinate lyase n=1 Tax=Rhodothermus marinus (strain ATCC 43812 / DSM 4252 / R-10) TaxID=518766 RepID=D0MJ53_RHOM4|nr:argininosuccinate lyase [Rhodothermus marinus]ACY48511.1 argininosuccinate lyase [Rhodothermus marinus DSM 4252]